MSIYQERENLVVQIIETKRLLEMVEEHPIMGISLKERLSFLEEKLEHLPKEAHDPKVQLLFSGNAVFGSKGIKSRFVSNTITPFQKMVQTQFSVVRFGSVGKRGQTRNKENSDLYLTALPIGSFGVELSQLKSDDLFGTIDLSNAIKQVINLVSMTAENDAQFEEVVSHTPKRNLTNLKSFLKEIVEENSVLKLRSGEVGLELPEEKVNEAFMRVSSIISEENEIIVRGTFRGLLLDSGKFEMLSEDGKRISGYLSPDLSEEQLIDYEKNFINTDCAFHLKVHNTKFGTGNERTDYELLELIAGVQL